MSMKSVGLKRWFSGGAHRFGGIAAVLGVAALAVFQARADVSTASYEIRVRRSQFVGQALAWVGETPPSEQESRALWEAMGGGQRKKRADIAASLEDFVKAHPQSPWRAAIEDRLGTYYREAGYFSLALSRWEESWNTAKGLIDEPGAREADQGLIDWLQLLASLGRTEQMKILLDESKGRTMPKPLRDAYVRLEQAYRHMLLHPEDSYRCGTFALNAVGKALYGTNYFKEIVQLASPQTGFSMAGLMAIAASNGLDLVAVERPSGQELVAPSVVHWKENHYAAITEQRGDMFRVADPTFRLSRWLSAEAINQEASGQFLVPSKRKPTNWRTLSMAECGKIFGKGWPPGGWQPSWGPPCKGCTCPKASEGTGSDDETANSSSGCTTCGGGGQAGAGMPQWKVTEPNIMLWLTDEPLAYQTASGGRMSFKTYYHYADFVDGYYPIEGVSFTANWRASWLSYVSVLDSSGSDQVTLYPLGGGERIYTNYDGTAPEYYSNTRMLGITNSGNPVAFEVLYPSGAKDVYGFMPWSAVYGYTTYYFLTQQIDASGRTTTYSYNADFMLQHVVDCDGRTNTFSYTWNPAAGSSNLLSRITDPFGRYTTFAYNTNSAIIGNGASLTNLVDAAGNSTTLGYSDAYYDVLSSMTTPYGTTSFDYGNEPNSLGLDLSYQYCHVTEADGGQQMFLYAVGNDFPGVPEVYTNTSNVPTNRPTGTTLDDPDWNHPGDNDYMNWANSFYWNRAQFPNLPADFLNSPTNLGYWNFDYLAGTNYGNGRMRHWNQSWSDIWGGTQGSTLSMEQEPSPDGATPGKMTWYDYPGKPQYNYDGASVYPSLVIRVQPDGSEWYQMFQTDQWGNRTNIISTYSSGGVVALRTNKYVWVCTIICG